MCSAHTHSNILDYNLHSHKSETRHARCASNKFSSLSFTNSAIKTQNISKDSMPDFEQIARSYFTMNDNAEENQSFTVSN